MSSELSIRSAKKLKGDRKREEGLWRKFSNGQRCKSVVGIFSCSGNNLRTHERMLRGRRELPHLHSSGNGTDLPTTVTQSAKCQEDSNSRVMRFKKQARKKNPKQIPELTHLHEYGPFQNLQVICHLFIPLMLRGHEITLASSLLKLS